MAPGTILRRAWIAKASIAMFWAPHSWHSIRFHFSGASVARPW